MSQLRVLRPQVADRRLRLIHSGRLLTDGIMLYEWLSLLEERQKRASDDTILPFGSNEHVYIHCSVGPKMDSLEEEAEESMDQVCRESRKTTELIAAFSQGSCNQPAASTVLSLWASRRMMLTIFGNNSIAIPTLTTSTLWTLRQRKNVSFLINLGYIFLSRDQTQSTRAL